jgi:hypothetical protein
MVLSLTATGARMALAPWDGDTFTVSLVGEGDFAAVADNLGPSPLGFVQFMVDASGKRDRFVLTFQSDGQTLAFTREAAQ